LRVSEKIGKVKKLFVRRTSEAEKPLPLSEKNDNADSSVEVRDGSGTVLLQKSREGKKDHSNSRETRASFATFAYAHFASRIPVFAGLRKDYEQSGISQIFEAYVSRALLASIFTSFACFGSGLVVALLLRAPFWIALMTATIFLPLGFAVSMFAWMFYPIHKRKAMKQSLENQLAYSIGILGVLSSSGIGVEDLFERISVLETNPVLAQLSRRFLRNVKVFGMDTAAALREVSEHCPSLEFSKFLQNIEVAFQTRGSLRDLISFESQRLFSEKRDKLRKSSNDLSVMAELYVSLVVVMPIFFIVMFVIFQLLPKVSTLPPATLMTNILLFIGVPVVSTVFVIVLDSMVQRT
jgi:Flp pilus assembly protein TadB